MPTGQLSASLLDYAGGSSTVIAGLSRISSGFGMNRSLWLAAMAGHTACWGPQAVRR